MTTEIKANGRFHGEMFSAKWQDDIGFLSTGNEELDREILQLAVSGVSVGGTYYPKVDSPEWALVILCSVFDEAPEIESNVDFQEMPYEAGEDAVY